jgi:hypothetical protein
MTTAEVARAPMLTDEPGTARLKNNPPEQLEKIK